MKNEIGKMILGAALAIGVAAVPMAGYAAPLVQDHHDDANHEDHPEWHTNRYYQLGNREGYQDHGRNVQRKEHNHHYRNDEDRRAHDYGYQQGWSGTRYDRDHH